MTKPSGRAIEIYDTTLRDGSQGEGISYSVQDKLRIAEKLDWLGVSYIEAGWPGSNPKDMAFFQAAKGLKLKRAELVAFGSTRRAGTKTAEDSNLKALVEAGTGVITIFGKTWDLHVKDVFKTTLEENLAMIRESVGFLKSKGKRVIYDAEHFFDGYRSSPSYAMKTLQAAAGAGAETLVLCDTNGGSMPSFVTETVKAVRKKIKKPLGIHVHNDGGMAVANSISAVEAGASQVQGTFNGCGERCGNADLVSVIPNLQIKLGFKCIPAENLKRLTDASRFIAEVGNMILQDNQPYVGKSAFAHKGGVHINAVQKNRLTYEHIDPALVGNHQRLLVSELMGKTRILEKAKELGIALTKDDPRTSEILKEVQRLENEGYQFEAAEASFTLILRKKMEKKWQFYESISAKVDTDKLGDTDPATQATSELSLNGKAESPVRAEGDGPVNALDNALRKALVPHYPSLAQMHLSDFKVRVIDPKAGTAAKVRVFIESQDKQTGEIWTTVGVSTNVIEASWKALVDSIEYKLLKDRQKLR